MHIHIERDGMVLDWDIADPKIAKEAVRTIAALLGVLLKPESVKDKVCGGDLWGDKPWDKPWDLGK